MSDNNALITGKSFLELLSISYESLGFIPYKFKNLELDEDLGKDEKKLVSTCSFCGGEIEETYDHYLSMVQEKSSCTICHQPLTAEVISKTTKLVKSEQAEKEASEVEEDTVEQHDAIEEAYENQKAQIEEEEESDEVNFSTFEEAFDYLHENISENLGYYPYDRETLHVDTTEEGELNFIEVACRTCGKIVRFDSIDDIYYHEKFNYNDSKPSIGHHICQNCEQSINSKGVNTILKNTVTKLRKELGLNLVRAAGFENHYKNVSNPIYLMGEDGTVKQWTLEELKAAAAGNALITGSAPTPVEEEVVEEVETEEEVIEPVEAEIEESIVEEVEVIEPVEEAVVETETKSYFDDEIEEPVTEPVEEEVVETEVYDVETVTEESANGVDIWDDEDEIEETEEEDAEDDLFVGQDEEAATEDIWNDEETDIISEESEPEVEEPVEVPAYTHKEAPEKVKVSTPEFIKRTDNKEVKAEPKSVYHSLASSGLDKSSDIKGTTIELNIENHTEDTRALVFKRQYEDTCNLSNPISSNYKLQENFKSSPFHSIVSKIISNITDITEDGKSTIIATGVKVQLDVEVTSEFPIIDFECGYRVICVDLRYANQYKLDYEELLRVPFGFPEAKVIKEQKPLDWSILYSDAATFSADAVALNIARKIRYKTARLGDINRNGLRVMWLGKDYADRGALFYSEDQEFIPQFNTAHSCTPKTRPQTGQMVLMVKNKNHKAFNKYNQYNLNNGDLNYENLNFVAVASIGFIDMPMMKGGKAWQYLITSYVTPGEMLILDALGVFAGLIAKRHHQRHPGTMFKIFIEQDRCHFPDPAISRYLSDPDKCRAIENDRNMSDADKMKRKFMRQSKDPKVRAFADIMEMQNPQFDDFGKSTRMYIRDYNNRKSMNINEMSRIDARYFSSGTINSFLRNEPSISQYNMTDEAQRNTFIRKCNYDIVPTPKIIRYEINQNLINNCFRSVSSAPSLMQPINLNTMRHDGGINNQIVDDNYANSPDAMKRLVEMQMIQKLMGNK